MDPKSWVFLVENKQKKVLLGILNSKTIIIAFSEQGFESEIVPVAIGHTL